MTPKCKGCQREFNSTVVPHVLQGCGHSHCGECLRERHVPGLEFVCGVEECGMATFLDGRPAIEACKKNFQLIEILEARLGDAIDHFSGERFQLRTYRDESMDVDNYRYRFQEDLSNGMRVFRPRGEEVELSTRTYILLQARETQMFKDDYIRRRSIPQTKCSQNIVKFEKTFYLISRGKLHCYDTVFNRDHEQFLLALCRICRHMMNVQNRMVFFNHELACFKRDNL